jgi:tripartite-type tricarboxylate transporter receptor subunit TctC
LLPIQKYPAKQVRLETHAPRGTPEAFAEKIKSDIAKFTQLVKAARIQQH